MKTKMIFNPTTQQFTCKQCGRSFYWRYKALDHKCEIEGDMKEEKDYIIIDTFGEPFVCVNKRGKTLCFETEDEANQYGEGNLQSFQVVKLDH